MKSRPARLVYGHVVAVLIVTCVARGQQAALPPPSPPSSTLPRLDDYVRGLVPTGAYTIQVFSGLQRGADEIRSQLVVQGVEPVTAYERMGDQCVGVGRFMTLAQAWGFCSYVRRFCWPDAFVTKIGGQADQYGWLDLGTSAPVFLPVILKDPNVEDYALVAPRFAGKSLPQLRLEVRQAAARALSPVDTSGKTTSSIDSLRQFIFDLPDTCTLKVDMLCALAEEELRMSKSVSALVAHIERFKGGKMADTMDAYWDHCFRFADVEHEFLKRPEEASLLYSFILSSSHAPERKRVRALVELAALSREFAGRQIGQYGDIAYWNYAFRRGFSERYYRAAAVLELLGAENFTRDYMVRNGKHEDLAKILRSWATRFHSQFRDCKRERCLAYALELSTAAGADDDEQYLTVAREATTLLPLPDDEFLQWGGSKSNPLWGVLQGAVRRSKDTQMKEMFTSYLAQCDDGTTAQVIPNAHAAFEASR